MQTMQETLEQEKRAKAQTLFYSLITRPLMVQTQRR
jgi:hypothetical protein